MGLELEPVHTSGHAAVRDMLRLRRAFGGARVIPIHTGHAERYASLFDAVTVVEDGQWRRL